MALAPPAFVLVMGYTEAIALCALLGAILAARARRWEVVVACGLAAGLARPTGILLVPAVRRWSPPLSALAVATTLIAVSAENLGSFERYVWASVVPVLTVAWLCRGRTARRVAPIVAGAGMAILATLAFLGYYVP